MKYNSILLTVISSFPLLCNILPIYYSLYILNGYFNVIYIPTHNPWYLLGLIWSVVELCFFCLMSFNYWRLNQQPCIPRPAPSHQHAKELIRFFLEQSDDQLLSIIRRWIDINHAQEYEGRDINQSDALNFISWMIYDVPSYRNLKKSQKKLIQAELKNYPTIQNLKIEKNPFPLSFYNRNKLKFIHLPFLIYFINWNLQLFTFGVLKWWGFHLNQCNGLGYWIRKTHSDDPPIVFCHGVGFGLFQYLTMIYKLITIHSDRTIVLFQMSYISLNLVNQFPSREDHIELIDHLFETHQLQKANWITHSFGSIIPSYVAHSRSQYINQLTFVDPICIGMFYGDSLCSLISKIPTCWTLGFIRYFGMLEYSLIQLLYRKFYWDQKIFWPIYQSNIVGKITIFLSEFDPVIDHQMVTKYLDKHFDKSKTQYEILKNAYHGGYLFDKKLMERVVHSIK